MSIALSVNLNKIALIRNSREGNFPNVTEFAKLCLDAGADGITVHPRPDQRHIRPSDIKSIHALIKSYPNREFNIEGNPFAEPLNGSPENYPGFIELVRSALPHQCTLVPDNNTQLTSDHGFDLNKDGDKLIPIIEELKSLGVRVSLFMDPDCIQLDLAKKIGADRIEFYTGPYAALFNASDKDNFEKLFEKFYIAAEHANSIGLGINAGHDLNLENMPKFATIPGLQEVSIGHALTVDSLLMGMQEAVQKYLKICH
ncbi:MAG: pyridoxine 5'-phosphate synthase [Cellvibrionaceae bacterium]